MNEDSVVALLRDLFYFILFFFSKFSQPSKHVCIIAPSNFYT
jgi:hypothetical protein